jgi:hypothetical protein
MSRPHTFQTPQVGPCAAVRADAEPSSGSVILEVSRPDAERIVRALDASSLNVAVAPGGSRLATAYRRLAADLRAQAAGS